MSDQETTLNIAVVGVEGAGKTVFLTTLASRQNNPSSGELLFVPKESHVLKYVNRNWEKLQNGQWPDFTPQTEVLLEWTLKTCNGHLGTLITMDMAGHDVRLVFADSLADDTSWDKFDYDARRVCVTMSCADLICLMINLKHTASLDFAKRTEDEAVLLNILKYAVTHDKYFEIILSQWSDCEEWVSAQGGTRQVLKNLLPNLYSAIVLYFNNSDIFFEVSAVVETETKISDNGNCYQVPQIGFSSRGIHKFCYFLSALIEGKARVNAKLEAEDEARVFIKKGGNAGAWIGVVIGVGSFMLWALPADLSFVSSVVIGGVIGGVSGVVGSIIGSCIVEWFVWPGSSKDE